MTFSVRTLPVAAIMVYLLATVALFWFGPLPWPVSNPGALSLFIGFALTGICAFSLTGSGGTPAGTPLANWQPVIVVGAVLGVAILFPSAYYYADKMPWQLLDAMRDQSGVYEALQKKLAETANERTLIALARAVTYPLIFAVLPLGILNWRRMNWKLWLLVLATELSGVIFSILRGTDREVFDIIFVASASIMVVIVRQCIAARSTLASMLVSRNAALGVIAFLVVLAVAINVFADRRAQRAIAVHKEGFMCIRTICIEPDHLLVRHVGPSAKYAVLMLTSYLTQGYYGLSLALTEPFHSTLGLGHAPVIARTYERLTHDNSIYQRGYTFGLRNMDWSDESQWSTIFPWLANDVGFPGAIAVICLLAFLLGRSWRDAAGAKDDRAAIVFCLLFQLFIYVPANNQLAQTFDGYLSLAGWCGFWLFAQMRNRSSGVSPMLGSA